MERIRAFVRGFIERNSDITTHYDDPIIEWYDRGRNLGERLTAKEGE